MAAVYMGLYFITLSKVKALLISTLIEIAIYGLFTEFLNISYLMTEYHVLMDYYLYRNINFINIIIKIIRDVCFSGILFCLGFHVFEHKDISQEIE